MAIVAHRHEIHVMTRFRGQVLSRAAVLLAVSALTWALPQRGTSSLETPMAWLGSAVVEVRPVPAVALLIVLAVIGLVWQRVHPADMGALAWVVAGGALAAGSACLVVLRGLDDGPVYWWLGLGVVVTSMTLQVLAAVLGHALAVWFARRS